MTRCADALATIDRKRRCAAALLTKSAGHFDLFPPPLISSSSFLHLYSLPPTALSHILTTTDIFLIPFITTTDDRPANFTTFATLKVSRLFCTSLRLVAYAHRSFVLQNTNPARYAHCRRIQWPPIRCNTEEAEPTLEEVPSC